VIRVPIFLAGRILSVRTRSTLRILPRSGSTAWNSRLRPCLALPPAESTLDDDSSALAVIPFPGSRRACRAARGYAERALPRQFARLARGFARSRSLDHLADDHLGLGRMFLEPRRQRLVEYVLDDGTDSEETSLSLVCEENFGSGTFTESTAVRPSRQSSPVSAIFSFLALASA